MAGKNGEVADENGLVVYGMAEAREIAQFVDWTGSGCLVQSANLAECVTLQRRNGSNPKASCMTLEKSCSHNIVRAKRSLTTRLYNICTRRKFENSSIWSKKVINCLGKSFTYCTAQKPRQNQSISYKGQSICYKKYCSSYFWRRSWTSCLLLIMVYYKKDPLIIYNI